MHFRKRGREASSGFLRVSEQGLMVELMRMCGGGADADIFESVGGVGLMKAGSSAEPIG